jgi:hypothetical protein
MDGVFDRTSLFVCGMLKAAGIAYETCQRSL